LNYKKHLMFPFGSHVQGTLRNDPTNTNTPRTIDAIYLRSMPNNQGGHEAISLSTGKNVTHNTVFEISVTDTVIKHVEAMAEAQGIKSLKLANWLITRFYPVDRIAGVDYDPEIQKHTKMMKKKTMNMRIQTKTHGSILMKTGCPQKKRKNGGQSLKPGQTTGTQTLNLNGTVNMIPLTRAKSTIYSTKKIPILSSLEPQGHTEEWRSCLTHFQKQTLQEWPRADLDVVPSQSHTPCPLMLSWPSISWTRTC